MDTTTQQKLLSVECFADALGLRPPTVRDWIAKGRIAKVKLGRRVLIPYSEVARLIQQHLVPPNMNNR